MHRPPPLCPGLHAAGHAARPRHPSARDRAQRSSRSTSPRCAAFRTSASSGSRAFWRSSPRTSGRRCARPGRSRRPGATGGAAGQRRTRPLGAHAPVDRDQEFVNRGDSRGDRAARAEELSATYFWPFQSHASLGPSCAVAESSTEGATIWSSSQGTHGLRANLSKVFGIPSDKLRVIFLDGSGSYGTNGGDHAAADAAAAVEDDRTAGAGAVDRARMSTAGIRKARRSCSTYAAVWTAMAVSSRGKRRCGCRTQRPGARAARGRCGGPAAGARHGAGAITQNGDPPYAAANVRVVVHWLKETPLRLSNLRAPGKIANVFAVESFTDELAAAAGVDSGRVPPRAAHRPTRDRRADTTAAGRLADAAVAESTREARQPPASAAAWPTCATSRRRTTSRWRWRWR